MNELIESLLQRGGLITPQSNEYIPTQTDYITDDDLYEQEFPLTDANFSQRSALINELKCRDFLARQAAELGYTNDDFSLDNYFRDYNYINGLTNYDFGE